MGTLYTSDMCIHSSLDLQHQTRFVLAFRAMAVFTHVRLLFAGCWFVGLSARLHKNYWRDFPKTWIEDEFQPLTFGEDLDKGTDPRTGTGLLQDRAFFDIFIHFSGNNAWIMMKKTSGVFRWLVSMSDYKRLTVMEACTLLSAILENKLVQSYIWLNTNSLIIGEHRINPTHTYPPKSMDM